MKKLLVLLCVVLCVVLITVFSRALLATPAVIEVQPAPELEIDTRRVIERLGKALRIRSVAAAQPDAVGEARLQEMADFILETFVPLASRVVVERHPRELVLRWQGSDPTLAPLLLLAHLDVVPAGSAAPEAEPDGSTGEDGVSSDGWKFPPFSGAVAAGSVWGRGALDDKGAAMAMMEAAEILLTDGGLPRRSVIFAFGLDEEIGGAEGAAQQALRFADEGLEPFMILDEGFAVLDGVIDSVPAPVAGIGIAEKGHLTVTLEVREEGGHASMPARQTSIGILSEAITRLEANPCSARLNGAVAMFFDELAPSMPFGPRLLFTNRWLTAPILVSILDEKPSTAATLRTTTAVTTARGGVAENVLPGAARATVNFRIHPSDSVASVLQHVRDVVNDKRVSIATSGTPSEPSRLSPTTGPAWELLSQTIRETYPGVIVAPTLVLGATDSRHYSGLCERVYRFNGLRLGPQDLGRIHGENERITTRNYLEMIRFYLQLMRNA